MEMSLMSCLFDEQLNWTKLVPAINALARIIDDASFKSSDINFMM